MSYVRASRGLINTRQLRRIQSKRKMGCSYLVCSNQFTPWFRPTHAHFSSMKWLRDLPLTKTLSSAIAASSQSGTCYLQVTGCRAIDQSFRYHAIKRCSHESGHRPSNCRISGTRRAGQMDHQAQTGAIMAVSYVHFSMFTLFGPRLKHRRSADNALGLLCIVDPLSPTKPCVRSTAVHSLHPRIIWMT